VKRLVGIARIVIVVVVVVVIIIIMSLVQGSRIHIL